MGRVSSRNIGMECVGLWLMSPNHRTCILGLEPLIAAYKGRKREGERLGHARAPGEENGDQVLPRPLGSMLSFPVQPPVAATAHT